MYYEKYFLEETIDVVDKTERKFNSRVQAVAKKINYDFDGEYKKILEKKSTLSAMERSLVRFVFVSLLMKKHKEENTPCPDTKESETE